MSSFKNFLRSDNFWARGFTFGIILAGFRVSLEVGKICKVENHQSLKLFGAAGFLAGAYIAHQVYYRWIFPEKRKATLPKN